MIEGQDSAYSTILKGKNQFLFTQGEITQVSEAGLKTGGLRPRKTVELMFEVVMGTLSEDEI